VFLEERKKYTSLREEFVADLQKRFNESQNRNATKSFIDNKKLNDKKSFFK
jgi:hypothetical protein